MIELNYETSIQDYRKLLFNNVYRQPILIIITLIGFSQLFIVGYSQIEPRILGYDPLIHIGIGVLILVGIPLAVSLLAQKLYKTDKVANERLKVIITDSTIFFQGESFQSETPWGDIQKIKKQSLWIFAYKDSINLIFIPLKAFQNSEDLAKFWEYVDQNNVPRK